MENSVIIIGSILHQDTMYNQLISCGYPKERIFHGIVRELTGFQYFDYFEPNEHEIFVDVGSLNGKTSVEFTNWANKGYDYIYAFEANPDSIEDCKKTFKEYELKGEVIGKGLWNKEEVVNFNFALAKGRSGWISKSGKGCIETTTLDHILAGNKVTFIKMDIEGAEYNALIGSKLTIQKWKPRLAICVYHKPEDILEIPALLLDIQPDYKFALRQYLSDGHDTILYAY